MRSLESPSRRLTRLAVAAALCLLPQLIAAQPAPPKRPVDYVDPRIDTHQTRWIFFASASRPFGMVSLSPDTRLEGDWGAGYIYVEPYIRAFSHIHDWQLAGVPVMPVVGRMNGHEGYEAYKAPFSHEREIVRAGYHKVVLDNSGITAELTSTARVGFHRYAFPATQDAYILLDIGAPIAMTTMADASIRRTGPRQLAGYSTMAPTVRREKPCTVYFVVDFDRDVAEFGGWERTPAGKAVRPHVERVAGPDSGGFVRFRFSEPGQVLMKVAISYVSEENARRNLEAELPGWDFDGTVRAAADDWNAWLSTIEVSGGTDEQRVKFYTDLWHALLGRRTFSDADGRYVDNTGTEPRIRRVPLDAEGRPDAGHVQQRLVLGLAVEPERALVVRVPAHDERAGVVAGGLLHQRRHDRARSGRRPRLVRDDRRPGHAVDCGGLQQGHPRFRCPGRVRGRAQERLPGRHPGPGRIRVRA